MVQGTSAARAFSVMQELQQLRDKVGGLSEKNRQLAKALTATKQELTRARAAQTAVFSSKVVEWMDARHKPVEVRHQAAQCNLGGLGQDLEPEPPLSPRRSNRSTQIPASRMQSQFVMYAKSVKHGKIIGTDAIQEWEYSYDDGTSSRKPATSSSDCNARLSSNTVVIDSSTSRGNGKAQALQVQAERSPQISPGSSSQASAPRRLRRRDASVSYVEPKLNTKLRRGDYYGLGKRTGQQRKTHHPRTSPRRVISEPRRATSAFVPAPFAQQRSPFRRRTMRPVQRVSYAEPKLNTKLRQGDKFTFTT